jgi:hypothetical protein
MRCLSSFKVVFLNRLDSFSVIALSGIQLADLLKILVKLNLQWSIIPLSTQAKLLKNVEVNTESMHSAFILRCLGDLGFHVGNDADQSHIDMVCKLAETGINGYIRGAQAENVMIGLTSVGIQKSNMTPSLSQTIIQFLVNDAFVEGSAAIVVQS